MARKKKARAPRPRRRKAVAPPPPAADPIAARWALLKPLLQAMSGGETRRAYCRRMREADPTHPTPSTISDWVAADEPAGLTDRYAQARELQVESWADQIKEIADDGSNDTASDGKGNVVVLQDVIARSRLRIDTLKWLMSKLVPQKYGERMDVTSGGKPVPVTVLVSAEAATGGPTLPSRITGLMPAGRNGERR